MKRISLYIVISILVINYTTGQNINNNHKSTDTWEVDTIILYDTNGNLERFINTYSDKGYLESSLREKGNAVQWNNYYRTLYTYDAMGNNLTIINQLWLDDQWNDKNKHLYTYDGNGNLLTDFFLVKIGEQWGDTSKTINTYDNKNNLLSRIIMTNNTFLTKTTEQYDENNNLGYVVQIWKNDQWENESRVSREYNNNNDLIKTLSEKWNDEQWNNSFLTQNTYNTENKYIGSLSLNWENNQWENSRRDTCMYEDNNTETRIYYNWKKVQLGVDEFGWKWVEQTKNISVYDDNDKILIRSSESWTDGAWKASSSTINTYDEHYNTLSTLTKKRSSFTNEIENDILTSWEYDENSNAISGLCQQWSIHDELWNDYNTVLSFYCNNMQHPVAIIGFYGYKFKASYKKVPKVSVADILKENPIVVFPNPARSQFTVSNVENASVYVYNILGQKLRHIISKEESIIIQTEDLPAGMYVLKVEKGNTVYTKKVQVAK